MGDRSVDGSAPTSTDPKLHRAAPADGSLRVRMEARLSPSSPLTSGHSGIPPPIPPLTHDGPLMEVAIVAHLVQPRLGDVLEQPSQELRGLEAPDARLTIVGAFLVIENLAHTRRELEPLDRHRGAQQIPTDSPVPTNGTGIHSPSASHPPREAIACTAGWATSGSCATSSIERCFSAVAPKSPQPTWRWKSSPGPLLLLRPAEQYRGRYELRLGEARQLLR